MWFDEDDDRGEWCLYSRATPQEMAIMAERPTSKFPGWAEEAGNVKMTPEEAEAEFNRLWLLKTTDLSMPAVWGYYCRMGNGALGLRIDGDVETVSDDPAVVEAFIGDGDEVVILTYSEVKAMMTDELNRLIEADKRIAHDALEGYWVDSTPVIAREARPDASLRNLVPRVRNGVKAQMRAYALSVIEAVSKAVKEAAESAA